MKRPERVAAVEKIEEKRKPEDFFGHRNRGMIAQTRGLFYQEFNEYILLNFVEIYDIIPKNGN